MGQAELKEIDNVFKGLKPKERKYVLNIVNSDDGNKSQAARDAGYPEASAGARAGELSQRPEIQQAIANLQAKIGNIEDIDIKALVNATLVDQVLNASQDRDKQSAAVSLGKTQKMFIDVQDTTTRRTEESTKDLLDRIERELGKEARERASIDLGIDED